MKNIILILLLMFIGYFNINISNAGYSYPYICDNDDCYNTYEGEIKKNDNKYFLTNEAILKNKSLREILNEKLNYYKEYYGESTFVISNFYITKKVCEYNKQKEGEECKDIEELEEKKFNLSEIINHNDKIKIGKKTLLNNIEIEKEYIDGYDYLYSNFSNIIDKLHVGFPIGDKKNKLNDLFKNIVLYNTSDNIFYIKNVCRENDLCEKSEYLKLKHNSNNKYSFLDGDIKHAKYFALETFKVSNYSVDDYFMKAGSSLNAIFGFQDYLDIGKENTEYEYIISYKYDGGNIIDSVKETIKISKDFKLSSDTIKDEIIKKIFTLKILDERRKKIELNIREGFKFTKSGKVTFYLSVENLNTGDKFDRTAINDITKIHVLPEDKIGNHITMIDGFSKEDNQKGYNKNDTFGISIDLKDIYGNHHYDTIDGYELSINPGSSNSIELSHQGSNEWAKNLTGLKSLSNEQNIINFKIRFTKEGYHNITGFNLKFKEKLNNSFYKTPVNYIAYNGIIPSELYDSNGQLLKFYIKSSKKSDFYLKCTNNKIIINTTCISDDFSGCNHVKSQSITFNSQSQNGSIGTLIVQDYAYNQRSYNYNMNHIDQTYPTIQLLKGTHILNKNIYSYKVNNDDLNINLYEWTTSNCDAETNLVVKIDGIEQVNEKFVGSRNNYKILGFFKKSKIDKKLYIKVTDKYGNTNEKTITFNIYPSNIDVSKSLLSVDSNGDKFANNDNYYTYTLNLRDEFNNPIYGKKINLIDQNCNHFTGCKTLKTDMINKSGNDAIIEYDFHGTSDSNGKITFKVKSLAPGVFTQRFKIKINKWDNNYTDLSDIGEYYILSGNNSFKKPFIGQIEVSKDGINYVNHNSTDLDTVLQIGTNLSFRLKIIKQSNLDLNILNDIDNLSNLKNYISIVDDINTKLQNLSDIIKDNSNDGVYKFSARINTSENAKVLGIPGIKIENSGTSPIYISYNLGGEKISYYLGNKVDDYNNTDYLKISNNNSEKFIGIKVIGSLQGEGKQEITGQNTNFSDLSKSELRTQIRSNAYTYIKSMTSGQIVNGVKYVVGDTHISGNNLGYETLVVKDGNVIISGDLTQSKLGIIVLKDNYDVNNDYSNKGNIYIKPNVTQINAIMYADGGIMSINDSGNIYTQDSDKRTLDLQNQLVINGTLFTRNTIGGAILAGGKYILPGGSKIDDFDKAMIYDLNYLRRGNKGCQKDSSGKCIFKNATVIKYDNKIQLDPPKLFSK